MQCKYGKTELFGLFLVLFFTFLPVFQESSPVRAGDGSRLTEPQGHLALKETSERGWV